MLERKAGVQVLDQDVFASVVGGARIDETLAQDSSISIQLIGATTLDEALTQIFA